MENYQLSVIVITKDQIRTIETCLSSIIGLTDDIIVFDDGSTDGTYECLQRYSDRVKIIRNPGQPVGPGGGRNIASAYAKGDYLFFVDGDIEVNRNFGPRALRHFDARIRLVIGKLREYQYDENWSLIRKCERITPRLDSRGRLQYIGGCMIIEKRILEELGGFVSDLKSMEDNFLIWKLQKKYRARQIDCYLGIHHTMEPFTRKEINRHRENGYYFSEGMALGKAIKEGVVWEYFQVSYPFFLWLVFHGSLIWGIASRDSVFTLPALCYYAVRLYRDRVFSRTMNKCRVHCLILSGLLFGWYPRSSPVSEAVIELFKNELEPHRQIDTI